MPHIVKSSLIIESNIKPFYEKDLNMSMEKLIKDKEEYLNKKQEEDKIDEINETDETDETEEVKTEEKQEEDAPEKPESKSKKK